MLDRATGSEDDTDASSSQSDHDSLTVDAQCKPRHAPTWIPAAATALAFVTALIFIFFVGPSHVPAVSLLPLPERDSCSQHDAEDCAECPAPGGDGVPAGGASESSPPSSSAPSPALHSQHIERGRPISSAVTAAELFEAFRSVREEYDTRAFDPSHASDWEIIRSTSDDVEIALLQHPSDPGCPYVRMRASVDATRGEVWDFLALDNWERTMPHMDPFYEGLEMLGRYTYDVVPGDDHHHGGRGGSSRKAGKRGGRRRDRGSFDRGGGVGGGNSDRVEMVLARKRTTRIVTFGRRDFTFVSVSDVPRPDGAWVSGTVSIITDKFPREGGYVRAFQDSIAFYEPLPPLSSSPPSPDGEGGGRERTRLTIVCRIDLNDSAEGGEGGVMPMWLYVKTIGLTGVSSLRSMRRKIEIDREEKRIGGEADGVTSHHGSEADKRDPPRWCKLPLWMCSSSNHSPQPADERGEEEEDEELNVAIEDEVVNRLGSFLSLFNRQK